MQKYNIHSKMIHQGAFILMMLWVFMWGSLHAQEYKSLRIIGTTKSVKAYQLFALDSTMADKMSIQKQFREQTLSLTAEGYLACGVDSVVIDNEVEVYVHLGEQYHLQNLSMASLPPLMLKDLGIEQSRAIPFDYQYLQSMMEQVIVYQEERGYPFASIRFDSIAIDEQDIEAVLHLDQGPLILFDSVIDHGAQLLNPQFLSTYLRISEGQAYRESTAEEVEVLLAQLPFLDQKASPYISFEYGKSDVHVKTYPRKVNRIDGIIGFLPNAQVGNSKPVVTGQFNLLLDNLFKRGIGLNLDWQALRPQTQDLRINYIHRQVFNSQINLKAGLDILKEDTAFLNRKMQLDFSVRRKVYDSWQFFIKSRLSNLLATKHYEGATRLPSILDTRLQLYGLGYAWHKVDALFLPTKGLEASATIALGNKRIIKNAVFEDSLYADLNLQDQLIEFNAFIKKYSRIKGPLNLMNHLSAGFIYNDNMLLNDMYRLGGIRSLRGFNEQEFFASQYLMMQHELRVLMGEGSYLFVFYDAAYVKNMTNDNYPMGLGAGISMRTNAGIFNFVYALGRTSTEGFDPSLSKIHFGYVSQF